jgi:putative hydrolase of the HAD superfamily
VARRNRLELIAFDGDDTLWHNERSFRAGRHRFQRLLDDAGVRLTEEEIDAVVNRVEIANIDYYGYGVSSFILSLIETAIDLTAGRVTGAELAGLIELSKDMLTEEIELFPGAREVVTSLRAHYPLMLITKGDLLHQTSKLERSGLREGFRFVEVVSHKTAAVYAAILARHDVDADRFIMIGNSLKSDVIPVAEAGGWAVHVPAALTWSHEHAALPADIRHRTFELTALDRLPEVIETIERVDRSSTAVARRLASRRAGAVSGRRRPPGGNRRS